MAGSISIKCPSCGTTLNLKNKQAVGKKAPCPKCRKIFLVQLPPESEDELETFDDADVEDDEFASDEAMPVDDEDEFGDEFDDEYSEPEPKSSSKSKKPTKKKSGGAMLPLAIVGGSVAVVGLLLALFLWLLRDSTPIAETVTNKIDIAYLPPDSEVFIVARVADVWNAPLAASVLQQSPVKEMVDETIKQYGIGPNDIESVTVGIANISNAASEARKPGADPSAMLMGLSALRTTMVMRTKTPVDQAKLVASSPMAQAATHMGQNYHTAPNVMQPDQPNAMYVAEPTLVVFGNEAAVKTAIEQGAKVARRPELDFVNSQAQILIVAVPDNPKALYANPAAQPSDLEKSISENVNAVCVGLTVHEGIDVRLQTVSRDQAGAQAVKASMDAAVAQGMQSLAEMKSNPGPFAPLITLGEQVLGSVQAQQSDTMVELAANVPANVKDVIPLVPGMLMQGMMSQGQMAGGDANFTMPNSAPGAAPMDGLPPGQLPVAPAGLTPSPGLTLENAEPPTGAAGAAANPLAAEAPIDLATSSPNPIAGLSEAEAKMAAASPPVTETPAITPATTSAEVKAEPPAEEKVEPDLTAKETLKTMNAKFDLDAEGYVVQVDLAGAPIVDKDLDALAELPRLTRLDVSHSKITDYGIEKLGRIKQLTALNVSGTGITNTGMVQLENLSELENFGIERTRLTNSAVNSIVRLPKLKNLFVAGTRLTPAAVARINRELPECTVVKTPLQPAQ